MDHPLGRYFAEIEEHELLAYECRELTYPTPAVINPQAGDTPIESGPVASSSNVQRDVTPLSVDAPSSISLHPSGPATHSTIPMKRSADAIEASDNIQDDPAQQQELVSEMRRSL